MRPLACGASSPPRGPLLTSPPCAPAFCELRLGAARQLQAGALSARTAGCYVCAKGLVAVDARAVALCLGVSGQRGASSGPCTQDRHRRRAAAGLAAGTLPHERTLSQRAYRPARALGCTHACMRTCVRVVPEAHASTPAPRATPANAAAVKVITVSRPTGLLLFQVPLVYVPPFACAGAAARTSSKSRSSSTAASATSARWCARACDCMVRPLLPRTQAWRSCNCP